MNRFCEMKSDALPNHLLGRQLAAAVSLPFTPPPAATVPPVQHPPNAQLQVLGAGDGQGGGGGQGGVSAGGGTSEAGGAEGGGGASLDQQAISCAVSSRAPGPRTLSPTFCHSIDPCPSPLRPSVSFAHSIPVLPTSSTHKQVKAGFWPWLEPFVRQIEQNWCACRRR